MKEIRIARKVETLLIIGIVSIALVFSFVGAEPQGPNKINITSSGRNAANLQPIEVQAKAGNVTSLVIDGTRVTEAWQGYYGNITGVIKLDDADNYTLFDWSLPNPTGEVFASTGQSVTWSKVYCINVSQEGSTPVRPSGAVSNINGTQIELNYGINLTDNDGLTETFNYTYSDTTGIRVGSVSFKDTDGCSSTHPYTDEAQNNEWVELILSDNSSIIFTSILRDDANAYKPGSDDSADFQMIVLENGHYGSESTVTSYYFFAELS